MISPDTIATGALALVMSVGKVWDHLKGKARDYKHLHAMRGVAQRLTNMDNSLTTLHKDFGEVKVELFGMSGTNGMRGNIRNLMSDMDHLKKNGVFNGEE